MSHSMNFISLLHVFMISYKEFSINLHCKVILHDHISIEKKVLRKCHHNGNTIDIFTYVSPSLFEDGKEELVRSLKNLSNRIQLFF